MDKKEYTLHLISHTHWDREWYQTFQQFRLRLVHLIDHVLNLLSTDPEFQYFMLDGQTVVLDDYLEIRPDKKTELQNYVSNGRILIGPWYILPDEFLVSPEATVRNLLIGNQICQDFGGKMSVGYIPDPFGHIGQMPQILCGFEIDSACVWRGLSDEPCEFWWGAPDGSKVFMAFLRDSYSNGANLTTGNREIFIKDVCQARDSLAPHSASSHLLVMHGTDHMEPPADTSSAVNAFNRSAEFPSTRIQFSTLPLYLSAVRADIDSKGIDIPIRTGELRNSKRAPLLPGVLSTRMWIKQRNQACQTLLEKWAEPFGAWANLIVEAGYPSERQPSFPSNRVSHPEQVMRSAWRLLIQCHPHDSICGCSIDQVHDEMRSRFDQVEQIGEEITSQSLDTLAEAIHTIANSAIKPVGVVTVFNPSSISRTDLASIELQLPEGVADFEIVDDADRVMPHQFMNNDSRPFVNLTMTPADFKASIGMAAGGKVGDLVITRFALEREDSNLIVKITFSNLGEPDLEKTKENMLAIQQYLEDPSITQYIIQAVLAATTKITFLAGDVPSFGYRTFWVRALPAKPENFQSVQFNRLTRAALSLASRLPFVQKLASGSNRPSNTKPPYQIENEFFLVEVQVPDGSLTVLDKRNGAILHGQNCFVDGGDCGDEYNYCPPEKDQIIRGARLIQAQIEKSPIKQTLNLGLEMKLPKSLSPDRKSRSEKSVVLPIQTRITLIPGIPRIEIQTEVENLAQDHRLRVHFPAPFQAQLFKSDGHFEIINRTPSPTPDGNLPYPDSTWSEQPRTEVPQQAFSVISNGKDSLLVANRGLPEVAVLPISNECHEIALTLLRCVGWLSREDLSTRRGHAGPELPTPGAQMPGRHVFDYAILLHSNHETVRAYHQAYAFQIPLRATATSIHPGPLPASGSMVSVTPLEFMISSVKTSEDHHGLIVRGYNLSSQPIQVTLKPWQRFENIEQVNLLETPLSDLVSDRQAEVTFQVSPYQIVSLKFS